MRSRSVPVPTGRGALAVLLTAVPALAVPGAAWWVFVGAVAAVVALLGVDFFSASHPNDVAVERRFPRSVAVGVEAAAAWRVTDVRPSDTSERRSALRADVNDALWPSLHATTSGGTVELEGTSTTLRATFTPDRRGRFPLGAITIRTQSALGLVSRQHTRVVPGSIVVTPRYRSQAKLATKRRLPLESGLRSVRAKGTGTDFDQLREYRPGDDFRRVDWSATARSQHPVVREYRAERNQQVVGLLDNGRVMAGTVAGVPRVELAMDAVLGLTDVALRFGDGVGLLTFDSQVRGIVPARHSRAHFARIAEAMYLLDPQYDESAYEPALRTAAARFRRRSLFVVFTDFSEAVVWDTLEPAVAAIGRTHLVMVAAVRDPEVVAWAASGIPNGPIDPAIAASTAAFRSAAAVLSLDDRERAAARLRAVGAVVVDSPPDSLAVDVVERYLELKAAGRL